MHFQKRLSKNTLCQQKWCSLWAPSPSFPHLPLPGGTSVVCTSFYYSPYHSFMWNLSSLRAMTISYLCITFWYTIWSSVHNKCSTIVCWVFTIQEVRHGYRFFKKKHCLEKIREKRGILGLLSGDSDRRPSWAVNEHEFLVKEPGACSITASRLRFLRSFYSSTLTGTLHLQKCFQSYRQHITLMAGRRKMRRSQLHAFLSIT